MKGVWYLKKTLLYIRAEHEIYIGNYPAGFKEPELKTLFKEYNIDVGKIRMKSDHNSKVWVLPFIIFFIVKNLYLIINLEISIFF